MEEEDDCLVPQNSFADERDLCLSRGTKSRKATQLSLTTTTSGFSKDRKPNNICTPPQSLQSNGPERPSPSRIAKPLSERSVSPNGSNISPKLSAKMHYDMEMLRSGHSTMYELKSRLYNRPNDSEVFKTVNCGSKFQYGSKVCQRII